MNQGTYIPGEYVPGHWIQGEYIPGHYIDGDYIGGHYVDGDFVEGHFVDGDYIPGRYVDGDWIEGRYEQIWVEGALEKIWVEGAHEQIWVDGTYEKIWTPGKHEQVWIPDRWHYSGGGIYTYRSTPNEWHSSGSTNELIASVDGINVFLRNLGGTGANSGWQIVVFRGGEQLDINTLNFNVTGEFHQGRGGNQRIADFQTTIGGYILHPGDEIIGNRTLNQLLIQSVTLEVDREIIRELVPGHYVDGEYIPGHYVSGEWIEGHYIDGEYIEGHYVDGEYIEGRFEQVWVDGAYEQIWVEGMYEQIYVPGAYRQIWVEGGYELVWVDGSYERVWVPGHHAPGVWVFPETGGGGNGSNSGNGGGNSSGGGIAGGGNSSGGGIGGGPSHSNANTAPPPLPRSSRIPEANDIIIIHDEPVPQTDFSVLEVEYEVEHEAQTITIEGTDAQATHFRYDMDANDHIAFATIEDTPQMPQTGLENTMGLLTAGLILSIFSAAVIGGFIRKLRL